MKKAILFAFLILVSSFLCLPSSTNARGLYEVTTPTRGKNNPAVKCPPGSTYVSCLKSPPTIPRPAPCPYNRGCKK